MMMLPPVSYRRAIKGPRRQRGPFPNKFRAESVAKEFCGYGRLEEPTAARSKPNQYSGRMGSALLGQGVESLSGRTQEVGLSSRKQGRKRAQSY